MNNYDSDTPVCGIIPKRINLEEAETTTKIVVGIETSTWDVPTVNYDFSVFIFSWNSRLLHIIVHYCSVPRPFSRYTRYTHTHYTISKHKLWSGYMFKFMKQDPMLWVRVGKGEHTENMGGGLEHRDRKIETQDWAKFNIPFIGEVLRFCERFFWSPCFESSRKVRRYHEWLRVSLRGVEIREMLWYERGDGTILLRYVTFILSPYTWYEILRAIIAWE